ncbi:hypothetical protein [Helicobacter rodentium]|nr:hypothetical protein [Helicobacter rodentium]
MIANHLVIASYSSVIARALPEAIHNQANRKLYHLVIARRSRSNP